MDESTVGASVKGDEALPDFGRRETGAEQQDLAALDDPDFLAERRRVREELERTPIRSDELTARFAALDEEFIRRARAAWARTS